VNRRFAVISGLLLSLLFWGCSPTLPGYRDARSKWTESQSVYHELELQAHAFATFKTKEFRRQYVREFGRLFALRARQRQALLAQELAEEKKRYVFIVILNTKVPGWNDLKRTGKVWRVHLANRKGDSVSPASIRQLDSRNPTWSALFPRLDPLYRIWELKFPRVTDTGKPLVNRGQHLDLIIAGAPATLKLSWRQP